MSEKKFYVYEHWRPDKNICFYVGLGSGRRCNVMYGRDRQHKRIQLKLERRGQCVEIRIIAQDLDRSEAVTREIERISYWRSLNIELVNRTAGGDGSLSPCDATRELMRQRKLGRKLTDEHKSKIAAKSRERAKDPEYIARLTAAFKVAANTPEAKERARKHFKALVRTPEHCAKISASKTGLKASPEHAAKNRIASLGRKQRPEEIERRRAANTGKKRSPEFCALMKKIAIEREEKKKTAFVETGTVH